MIIQPFVWQQNGKFLSFPGRLLQFMADDSVSLDLRMECAVVLGSLARGAEANVRALVEAGCIPILLKGQSAK